MKLPLTTGKQERRAVSCKAAYLLASVSFRTLVTANISSH